METRIHTDRLIILGLSEATLTMIFDNLESCGRFPNVLIVNNLARTELEPFHHPRFRIEILADPGDIERGAEAFLGVNKPANKRAVIDRFIDRDFRFTTIVHRSSSVSSTATVGRGVNINSLVSIAGFAAIGDFVSINRNASVGHHSEVAEFVTINPGVNIAGGVRIGARTQIGMGVNITEGLEIGSDTIVGAGSLVTKSLPSGVVASGNPCRVVKGNDDA